MKFINFLTIAASVTTNMQITEAVHMNARGAAVEHQAINCELNGQSLCRSRSNETIEDNGSLIQVNTTFSNTMSQENGTHEYFETATVHI